MTQPAVVIGRDLETGDETWLASSARARSTYVIGINGTGKSTLLETIAVQDMANGDGLCFLDPHEAAAERLLHAVPAERVGDVIFWDPTDRERPFGVNPFWCPNPEEIDSKADNFIAALASLEEFAGVFAGGAARMKNLLQRLAITFVVNQGHTLVETPEFLTNQAFRSSFYPALDQNDYAHIRRSWEDFDALTPAKQHELIGSSLNKLERLQTNRLLRGIFGQAENSIDFRQAMDENKIILVKLSGRSLGEESAAFIGAFIVWEIFQAALSRASSFEQGSPRFHIIADEFQRFMTSAFPRIIEEARKFGLDTLVAHQRRKQLGERYRDATLAVRNKIVFTVTGTDANELARELHTQRRIPAPEPLAHIANHGHKSPEVMEAHQRLLALIDTLVVGVEEVAEARPKAEHRERLQRALDDYVYAAMGEEAPPDAPAGRQAGDTQELRHELAYQLDLLYGSVGLYTLADELRDQRPSWSEELEEDWAEHFARVRAFWQEEELLREELGQKHGQLLANDPAARIWPPPPSNQPQRHFLSALLHGGGGARRTTHHTWANHHHQQLLAQQPPTGLYLEPYGYFWLETAGPAWFLSRERRIWQTTEELARLLRMNPPTVPAGSVGGQKRKSRAQSGQRADIAKHLATQPKFQAYCSLGTDSGPIGVSIATLPFTPSESRGRAQAIREHSRQTYGRSRNEALAALSERMDPPSTAPGPEPGMRVTVDDNGLPDDSELIFGENAEAAKAQARDD